METIIFAFGCFFPRIVKSWSLFWNFDSNALNSVVQFNKYSNLKMLQNEVNSEKYRFTVNIETSQ